MANLKKGSSGSDVEELQRMLNSQGYELDVDGVYGSKTEAAVRDYQSKNGLTADGIYGQNTYNSLNGVSGGSTNKSTADWLADYEGNRPEYQQSQAVNDAAEMLKGYEQNKPGAYQGTYDEQINQILNDITNQGKFEYDFNADPLYQQYKNNYTNLGQMAMMDTMGNASALSGGFANSYAQTAGQQAYQQYLGQLNNVIPELYNAAYNRFADERDNMYNQLNMYRDMDATDYGRYRDTVNDYYSDLDYYYNKYNNMSQEEYNRYRDSISDWQNDRNYWYGKSQDEQEQENWEKEYALAKSKASGGGGRGGGSGGSSSGDNYEPSKQDIISAAAYAYEQGGESAMAAVLEDAYQAGYITADNMSAMKSQARKESGYSGAVSPVSQMAAGTWNNTGYTVPPTGSSSSTTKPQNSKPKKKSTGPVREVK